MKHVLRNFTSMIPGPNIVTLSSAIIASFAVGTSCLLRLIETFKFIVYLSLVVLFGPSMSNKMFVNTNSRAFDAIDSNSWRLCPIEEAAVALCSSTLLSSARQAESLIALISL